MSSNHQRNQDFETILVNDEQELEYVLVQEDLDIIAQMVRFVSLHASNPQIATLWLEHAPRFRLAKSAGRSVSGKLDR